MIEATNKCGQDGSVRNASEDIAFGDSWFVSVEAVTHAWLEPGIGVRLGGIVKTSHSRYPKDYLETTMKDWPSGSHLVMEATNLIGSEEVELIAIGYKYNSRKVICFLCHKSIGRTTPGTPYKAKFRDANEHGRHRDVPRPYIISKYFKDSNKIDTHNHVRQSELALEKHWITNTGYFRIFTTILGMCVTDAWKIYKYNLRAQHADKTLTIIMFCDILVKELVENTYSSDPDFESTPKPLCLLSKDQNIPAEVVATPISQISPLTSSSGPSMDQLEKVRAEVELHVAVKRPLGVHDDGKSKRAKRTTCSMCTQTKARRSTQQTCFYCLVCKIGLCQDASGSAKDPDGVRYCQTEHQNEIRTKLMTGFHGSAV
jgi:hypothetical protein